MKRLIVFFSMLFFILLYSRVLDAGCRMMKFPAPKFIFQLSDEGKIKTVVIDAGHGGKDPGCLGSIGKEKNVTLAIALALGHYIEKNCPDVKVIYTRHDDNFVELFQRAEIANKNKADLFISIHCNSSHLQTAYGVETYVMGLYKSQANLNVAKKENSSILLENDYKKNYSGFDPNSPEAYIIFSLLQNAYIDQSLNLASKIEKEAGNAGRFKRGVKQAGFLVIYKTTMPSMLVEAGFLTNPDEEKFLMSETGQNTIALSIFKAFKEYKNEIENKKEKIETVNTDKEQVIADSSKLTIKNEKLKNIKVKSPDTLKPLITEKGVVFKVQFATSSVKKNLTVFSNQLSATEIDKPKTENMKVDFYFDNGLYKYTIGNEKKLKEAEKFLIIARDKGFKDAFIIAFSDGKRLKDIKEALNLQKNK